MERLRIERAGAFVEQAGQHRSCARLPGLVLRRAALEHEIAGHEGHRIILDEPGLEAAGRADLLDGRGAGLQLGGDMGGHETIRNATGLGPPEKAWRLKGSSPGGQGRSVEEAR